MHYNNRHIPFSERSKIKNLLPFGYKTHNVPDEEIYRCLVGSLRRLSNGELRVPGVGPDDKVVGAAAINNMDTPAAHSVCTCAHHSSLKFCRICELTLQSKKSGTDDLMNSLKSNPPFKDRSWVLHFHAIRAALGIKSYHHIHSVICYSCMLSCYILLYALYTDPKLSDAGRIRIIARYGLDKKGLASAIERLPGIVASTGTGECVDSKDPLCRFFSICV